MPSSKAKVIRFRTAGVATMKKRAKPKAKKPRRVAFPMGKLEIRDPDDEMWARGWFVHVERMDDDYVWIGFTRGKAMVHLDLVAKGPIKMQWRDER